MCKKNMAKWIFFGILFGCLAILAYGAVVMLLWNWLIPELFAGKEITFVQSLGLIALVKILFHNSWGGRCGGWKSKKHGYWKYKMKKHWGNLTPEEKVAMKEKFMQKCGPSWRGKDDSMSSPKIDDNSETKS